MLFGVSAALRWIGWHVIVFNFFGFLIFDPVGLRELIFFFVVIFWTPAQAFVVCGGLFFCWVSGFSRPVSDVVLKFFCGEFDPCLLYTSPSPRDATLSRMPSSA